MRKRGRKSSAELSVIPIGIDTHRPDPPADLTASQADIWRATVGSLPGGWIHAPQEPLLAAYCRHVDAGNWISAMINAADFEAMELSHLDKLLRMRERETRASSALATRMRLTQQSKMHPRTAGRASDNTRRPWDGNLWD